ncbi:MAG: hypothetical protein H5T99_04685, partial [Moorella sp. (in: Bacteria)]|nr:hypothetical protein [Moorella sp. (in: firmicutes)]
LEAAIAAARTIRNETLPVALELLDGAAMAVMARSGWQPGNGGAGVMAIYTGFKEQVDAQVEHLRKQFPATTLLEGEAGETAWQARRQLFSTFAGQKGAILASAAVPFTAMAEFLSRARAELDQNRKGAALVAHFGNAHIHIFLDEAPAAWTGARETIDRLASLAGDLGGLLMVDNIDDLTLARRWVESRGTAVLELLGRLKAAIDPCGIMAPNSKVLAYIPAATRVAS